MDTLYLQHFPKCRIFALQPYSYNDQKSVYTICDRHLHPD